MPSPLHQSRAQQLFELADAQAGDFTAQQALGLGSASPLQTDHQQVGHWQRAGHGLYRLAASPITEHEQLAGLTLWSRTRTGETQAVVSYDTALTPCRLSAVSSNGSSGRRGTGCLLTPG